MQFSESWLRQFVDPDLDTKALAHVLTMAGLEVESLHSISYSFSGVFIGLVEKIIRHPNADRLYICQVDVGLHGTHQIVCGAKNVKVGIKVACALIGATLPPSSPTKKAIRIKPGKLRGIDSFGMLCSTKELNINSDEDGIFVLPDEAPVGLDVREYLSRMNSILDIKVTPNRSDCLSVFGVAREVSTLTSVQLYGAKLNGEPLLHSGIDPCLSQELIEKSIKTEIVSNELCGRFCTRMILDLNARVETPQWMIQRLESAGQRSVSILVDLSNYFLLEYGIPSHIYDADQIGSSLVARWAKSGESLTLLNGETIELYNDVGVVADDAGPISLAGIMGGASSVVSEKTKNIVIEVAFWQPHAIRGRGRRYRLSTHACHCFERGVDFSYLSDFLKYLSETIVIYCGGKLGPINDRITNIPDVKKIILRPMQFQRQIGVHLSKEKCIDMLERLHCTVQTMVMPNGADIQEPYLKVIPPNYRFDIQHEVDLIGELARLYNFDLIPASFPIINHCQDKVCIKNLDIHFFRNRMAMLGYDEVVTYSFIDAKDELTLMSNQQPIDLLNPLSREMAVMRSSLLPGLLKVVQYHLNRNIPRVMAFEVGRVFHRLSSKDNDDLKLIDLQNVAQPMMVGAILYGSAFEEQWGYTTRVVDFFDVKGDVEALLESFGSRQLLSFSSFDEKEAPGYLHPNRSAKIYIGEKKCGVIGELHPAYLLKYSFITAPIFFECVIDDLPKIELQRIQAISRFPSVRRDIALIVEKNVSAESLKTVLLLGAKEYISIVQSISLFDVFVFDDHRTRDELKGKKSLAFSILLQDFDKTLSEKLINEIIDHLVQCAVTHCSATLRC